MKLLCYSNITLKTLVNKKEKSLQSKQTYCKEPFTPLLASLLEMITISIRVYHMHYQKQTFSNIKPEIVNKKIWDFHNKEQCSIAIQNRVPNQKPYWRGITDNDSIYLVLQLIDTPISKTSWYNQAS